MVLYILGRPILSGRSVVPRQSTCPSWVVESSLGGLLAVDGRTGAELWRHYSAHEVFAVNCNRDLNADLIHDCIVAGRVGVRC